MKQEKKKIVLKKSSTPEQRNRETRECAKMDPRQEQAMAEEGFPEDMKIWPKY
jgi:hypothetical protein